MDHVFSKFVFPKAPGGNLYEWNEAETLFSLAQTGLYVIKIVATAKNAQQNRSTDDDDLRINLDGFSFGKYERSTEQISWKGFGNSSSWDGSSLKGGTKTIYFFVELDKGDHKVQFFADATPTIKSLEVFYVNENDFSLANLRPVEKIKSQKKGIPWMSFVFLGTHPKNFLLDVSARSATDKGASDGDNMKVVVNGKVLQNERAKTSKKYQNFYFSGDIKSTGILPLTDQYLSTPLMFENSVELWYDEEPTINSLLINFFDTEKFLKKYESLVDLREYVISCVRIAKKYFEWTSKNYSAKFLQHSIEDNPTSLIFRANHPITRQIKADPMYEKIFKKIKEKISANIFEGEIWPEDIAGKISFDTYDLKTAIHGIKKIEYKAIAKKSGKFEVKMVLLDIYDFEKQDVPFFLFHAIDYAQNTIINAADMGEDLHIIHNFEIQINVIDHINETD